MTRDEQVQLDKLSYRLATVYQTFGRLQHEHEIDDDNVTVIMDELVDIGAAIDRISDAENRTKEGEHGFPTHRVTASGKRIVVRGGA